MGSDRDVDGGAGSESDTDVDRDTAPDVDIAEDDGLPEPEDTLEDRGVDDVLDEGYSPPERPRGLQAWGTTEQEQRDGESLDARLARERPESLSGEDDDEELGDGLGDSSDTDGELRDREVGDLRAGRLVEGETDLYAEDSGIDGGAASAEEAAVHLVPEFDEYGE